MIDECLHDLTTMKRKTTSNGSIQVVMQCARCGATVGGPIKHANAGCAVSDLPEFDLHLQESWWDSVRSAREAEKDRGRAEWLKEYDDYLYSEKWRRTRLLVLSRDGHVCQGCLNATATLVHHKNYSHVGDELLFDLVSLCQSCHDRVHQ